MDTRWTRRPEMEAILSVENIISDLLSSSMEKQAEGESSFNMMKEKDATSLALNLAKLVGDSNSYGIYFQQECANLLYKLLTDNNCHIWSNNLSVSTQSTIKSILLICINLEKYSDYIKEVLCRTVSAICNISNTWPELLHFLHEWINSNSNRLKESFFFIFGNLDLDRCQTLLPDIMMLLSLFLKTLNDDTLNLYARIAALAAAINFIQCVPTLNELKRVQSLYPAMMRTLADALKEGDRDDVAQCVLDCYIKLAKNEPRFFRTQIVDVVNTMFEIAEAMNLKEMTRHLALDFVLTLVEAKEKAPGMMKKLPRFTHSCFALLLKLLLDINDEPDWHSKEDLPDEPGLTDNYRFGISWINRFSTALGGKTVAPIAIELLTPYLVSPEWAKRHAALDALVHIVKGCSKVMIKYLKRVVSMVLRSFQHHHPRVRWAVIRSIAQMLIDFSPYLQEQHHNQLVPALVEAMDDFQNPRVQAVAAEAVTNYCCKSEKSETLLPYLDSIFNKLLTLVQNDNKMVQQKAIDALGAVAELSKEHFQGYYDCLMPYLRTILVNKNDKFDHILWGKALNCITMVGVAVGREKFRDDINQAIEALKSSQESQDKEFGTIVYILKAWYRLCCYMGKDFLPYMRTVMPFLIKCIQLEYDNITDELDNSVHFRRATEPQLGGCCRSNQLCMHNVKFGDEMIYVKGSDFLEVKSIACNVYTFYAQTLEEDFYPWTFQGTSIFVPILKYHIQNDVRGYAGTALFQLLNSAKLAVEKGIDQGENDSHYKQLSYDIILALGDALSTELDTNVCAVILSALSACLLTRAGFTRRIRRIASAGSLVIKNMMDVIKHVFTKSSHRKQKLAERAQAEDFDDEEAEMLSGELEQEEKVNEFVGNILRTLASTFKVTFLPFLDELSSYLMPLRGKDKTVEEKNTCLKIFAVLVEQCSEEALKYHDIYFPFLLDSINDENPTVRQNVLYGLAVCAEYGVSIFKPLVGEALPKITEVITHSHTREPQSESAYSIGVFALGKILKYHRGSIGSMQILPVWLNCLPIKNDYTNAAKVVHGQLCSMVERSDRELLGPNYEHFPKVLSIFAEILCAGKDLATEEMANRMINVLRNLRKTIPPATWASALSLLLPQQEMELESVLSPEEDANQS